MSITLKTGKVFDPNCGFIGLNEKGEVGEGSDQNTYCYEDCLEYDPTAEPTDNCMLTKAELAEIADLMIGRWQAFRKTLP